MGRFGSIISGIIATVAFCGAHATEADDAFDERVRNYLLNNPEIILEAMEMLAEREARSALTERLKDFPEVFESSNDLGIGRSEANVQVVEFFDYRCQPCKAIHPKLEKLVVEQSDIRIEMRHLPILTPGSERAARFALATRSVAGVEAYQSVHASLWETKGPLNSAAFERIAKRIGLDFSKIEPVMESDDITAQINYNRDFAIELEILGTPAFVTPTSVSFGNTESNALAEIWLSQ